MAAARAAGGLDEGEDVLDREVRDALHGVGLAGPGLAVREDGGVVSLSEALDDLGDPAAVVQGLRGGVRTVHPVESEAGGERRRRRSRLLRLRGGGRELLPQLRRGGVVGLVAEGQPLHDHVGGRLDVELDV